MIGDHLDDDECAEFFGNLFALLIVLVGTGFVFMVTGVVLYVAKAGN